jgi:hypothetical protein
MSCDRSSYGREALSRRFDLVGFFELGDDSSPEKKAKRADARFFQNHAGCERVRASLR